MLSEFELIRKYFTRPTTQTRLGVGDDCALIEPRSGYELAISTDMLVSGTHFLPDAEPRGLGHKVLAVNLSDLAAMGVEPRWCTLAAALPQVDEAWIAGFAQGFFALAALYQVDVIGGDTTRGPMNFCVSVMGEVPAGRALMRSGAQAGDDIWVSGEVGDAALALAHLRGHTRLADVALATCFARMHLPMPRVALGMALSGLATSCIDVSDGLLGDLGHILEMSGVGAEVVAPRVPMSEAASAHVDHDLALRCALAGGDDYELCFTAPPGARTAVEKAGRDAGVQVSRIGTILAQGGLRVIDADGEPMRVIPGSFDHFKS